LQIDAKYFAGRNEDSTIQMERFIARGELAFADPFRSAPGKCLLLLYFAENLKNKVSSLIIWRNFTTL